MSINISDKSAYVTPKREKEPSNFGEGLLYQYLRSANFDFKGGGALFWKAHVSGEGGLDEFICYIESD